MTDAAVTGLEPSVLDALRQIAGNDHVLTDAGDLRFFSSDVLREADPAEVVLQPGTVEELAQAVKTATAAGLAVIPRGGGLSYTDGYLPQRTHSMIVDMRRLDRILEINTQDMYVTVEAGCTWKALFEALKDKGVRTPYFGPLSGLYATIGGALSQNSMFFGSGLHGNAVDSVLGLEVVLADGQLLKLGSAATPYNPSPFFRGYGPDLAGIFLADCGALGFKVQATLRLIPYPEATQYASFGFDTKEQICAAMSEVSRQGLAAECFGFDPYWQGRRLEREGLIKDIKSLAGVARSGKTLLSGVKEAAKVMVAGRRLFEGVTYSMHVVAEGRDDAAVDGAMAAIREIALAQGEEISNSLPKVMRGTPFPPPNSMLGPDGERWVPIHALVPHSRIGATIQAIHDFFSERADVVESHGIEWGYLLATSGHSTFLVEPVFLWKDSRQLYHNRYLEDSYLKGLKSYPENLAARAAVIELRSALAQVFMKLGAAHFQIGKSYPYRQGREPATYTLLQAIKAAVDPRGLMNPGALGLE